MKVVGLITEYNPFHNGHKYHIEQAKKLTGADYAVVVMSGNFVQRGAPAILDKYTRCEMALKEGADLIFELPVTYATASAEYFAYGAVQILNNLGFVDSLCFGSECGNITLLEEIADVLLEEPSAYKDLLNQFLKQGLSFPAARQQAMAHYLSSEAEHSLKENESEINEVLSSPNNILGIEYIKALKKLNSKITPCTITRISSGYHEESLTGEISSASSIRKHVKEGNDVSHELQVSMPPSAFELFKAATGVSAPIIENDFSMPLFYKLLYSDSNSLPEYLDVNEDIALRIQNTKHNFTTISDYAELVKTKNLTHTRITRILFHILLNIKKELFKEESSSTALYLRLLGMKKEASFLIKASSREELMPILTKVADAKDLLTDSQQRHLAKEIQASTLYNQIVYEKYQTTLKDEYRKGIIII